MNPDDTGGAGQGNLAGFFIAQNVVIQQKGQVKPLKLRVVKSGSDGAFAVRIIDSPEKKHRPHVGRTFTLAIERAADEPEKVKRFEAEVDVDLDAKKMKEITDADGNVIDYKNVRISGYLSTFEGTTESDRQGDAVIAGAFRETIAKFMLNPVLLIDHRNQVGSIAGRFVSMKEDKKGLRFEAQISDAPGMADVRHKIANGMLVTTSMGGLFHYAEGGRKIFKVDLWEGSLVAIPANPDARFSIRSLNDEDVRFIKSGGHMPPFRKISE